MSAAVVYGRPVSEERLKKLSNEICFCIIQVTLNSLQEKSVHEKITIYFILF